MYSYWIGYEDGAVMARGCFRKSAEDWAMTNWARRTYMVFYL